MAPQRIEYRFVLSGQTPESVPQARLADYLADLAALYGDDAAVHFVRLEHSSLAVVSSIEQEADEDVSARIQTADREEASARTRDAYRSLQRRIAQDGGPAYIARGTARILNFPILSPSEAPARVYGPFWQPGSLQGTVILVGGNADPARVRIQAVDGRIYFCKAPRSLTKRLRDYLYEGPIRVTGEGQWLRDETGEWKLEQFVIENFSELNDEPLSATIARLRDIDAPWRDRPDPLSEIDELRRH